jgi:hypothetical protein
MDAGRIADAWLAPFAKSFEAGDAGAALGSFAPDGWLRDALVLTLDSRSLGGHARISDFLSRVLRPGHLSNFALDERPSLSPAPCAIGLTDGAELAFTFETPSALCRGLARLKQDGPNEEWKAASVFLMVDAWKGHEEIGPELGTYEGHTVRPILMLSVCNPTQIHARSPGRTFIRNDVKLSRMTPTSSLARYSIRPWSGP